MSSPITTHVLDLVSGTPAVGIVVRLSKLDIGKWDVISEGLTNADGRIIDLLPPGEIATGTYRLIFETGDYQERQGTGPAFFPSVSIDFVVSGSRAHYHVPLLLSPYGYSTYRGS